MEKHEQGEMKRAACSEVPKLSGIAIGTLHYPKDKTGLLCEMNIKNLRIVGCSHAVGWNLI